jgi:uncharacterized protein YndB with AHSA1/START domain
VETTVPTARERVYAVLADPRTYPDWLVGAQHIRDVDDGFPRPGTGFDHRVGVAAATVDDRTTSEAVRRDEELALRIRAGAFRARVVFELHPLRGGATSVRLSEEPVGWCRPLTPFLRVALAARNQLSLARLRHRVVRGAPRDAGAGRDGYADAMPTPNQKSDHGTIEEPSNSTVHDWHGQKVSDDEAMIDEVLEATGGDEEAARRAFEERSADKDPERQIDQPKPS